jgi:hypothetical protein
MNGLVDTVSVQSGTLNRHLDFESMTLNLELVGHL